MIKPTSRGDALSLAHLLSSRLRIAQFALIEAVARAGSLREAAKIQGVSQPAVTKSIREIEATLGMRIFERSATGVTPTPIGEQLALLARDVIADLGRGAEAIAAAARGESTPLRLAYIPSFSVDLLARGVSAFLARHLVKVQLDAYTSNGVLEAVRERRADCGIARFSGEDDKRDLQFTALYRQRPMLAHSLQGLPQDATYLDIMRLPGILWVMPPRPTPARLAMDRAFVVHGLDPPVAEIECAGPRLVQALLMQDARRVAVVPEDATVDIANRGKLSLLPCPPDILLPAICFVRSRDLEERPGISDLLSTLVGLLAADAKLADHAAPERATP